MRHHPRDTGEDAEREGGKGRGDSGGKGKKIDTCRLQTYPETCGVCVLYPEEPQNMTVSWR